MMILKIFYELYYSDYEFWIFIFGINFGWFGVGIIGVFFMDLICLVDVCGIEIIFKWKVEFFFIFVYEYIVVYGGVNFFY